VICDTPVLGDNFIFWNSQKTPRNLQEGLKLEEEHNPRLFHDNSEYEDVSCQHLNSYIVSCPQGGGGVTELPSSKLPNVPTLDVKKKRQIAHRHGGCFMSSLQRGSDSKAILYHF
jgi:hypothetical protein